MPRHLNCRSTYLFIVLLHGDDQVHYSCPLATLSLCQICNKVAHTADSRSLTCYGRPTLQILITLRNLVRPCLHGLGPVYLSTELQNVKDMPSRQRLRSWFSDTLAVPTSWLSTVGDRAFPVIAAQVWNTACGRYLVDHSASFQTTAQD